MQLHACAAVGSEPVCSVGLLLRCVGCCVLGGSRSQVNSYPDSARASSRTPVEVEKAHLCSSQMLCDSWACWCQHMCAGGCWVRMLCSIPLLIVCAASCAVCCALYLLMLNRKRRRTSPQRRRRCVAAVFTFVCAVSWGMHTPLFASCMHVCCVLACMVLAAHLQC